MPGPLSTPNGDASIIRGHIHEVFMCDFHGVEVLEARCPKYLEDMPKDGHRPPRCRTVSLREYLYKRNRLVTGKTK